MNYPYEEIFSRTALVAGEAMTERLCAARVLVVGVGGVGSWAAEALVRSGIGHITIVDSDTVAVTNINRQLPATVETIGRPKVEVLAERFLQINPELDIKAIQDVYSEETADSYDFDSYDFIIDAIDSLSCKALLILRASASKAKFFSSMGAARKLHASKIAVAEFWKVEGCPLARALRQRFKKTRQMPRRKFKCVYSPETLPQEAPSPNGTFMHTTAIFGLTLAGQVIEELYKS